MGKLRSKSQNITFQFSSIYLISKTSREGNCQELLQLLLIFNPETMRSLLYTVAAVAILSQVDASCENPKVQASSYTSSDSQVLTHIPFITEFTLTCSNGAASILSLRTCPSHTPVAVVAVLKQGNAGNGKSLVFPGCCFLSQPLFSSPFLQA